MAPRRNARNIATFHYEEMWLLGLIEPDVGLTRWMKIWAAGARRFLLNGSKMWITNSPIADVAVVWASFDDEGIGGFLVIGDLVVSTPT
jgi:alkylation response protein AidB-like acyl-CoA dehydrogenase